MCKLSNKAFSTIEVVVSMCIFSILFTTSLLVTMQYLKIKSYNLRLNKSVLFCEALINTLEYNSCENEVIFISQNSPVYIHEEDMNIDKLKRNELQSILSNELPRGEEIHIYLHALENHYSSNLFSIELVFRTEKNCFKYELFKELKYE